MKTIVVIFFLLHSPDLFAQLNPDSVKISNGVSFSTDSINPLPDTIDTRPRNAYRDVWIVATPHHIGSGRILKIEGFCGIG